MHLLHGFLYAALRKGNPKLGNFLHEEGFCVQGHRYKLMTFSFLFPQKARALGKCLEMSPPISWWVSSPLVAPIETLAMVLLTQEVVRIGKVTLLVDQLEVEEAPEIIEPCIFQTISPIVASTGIRKAEKLEHKYLSPEDHYFWKVIKGNLQRKAQALGISYSCHPLSFTPLGKWQSKLFTVQGTKVKGFMGRFLAEGPSELLRLGYEAGFGERNAQGFGMVKLVKALR